MYLQRRCLQPLPPHESVRKLDPQPGVSAADAAGPGASDDVLAGRAALWAAEVLVPAVEVPRQPNVLAEQLELGLPEVREVEASEAVLLGAGKTWRCSLALRSHSTLWGRAAAADDAEAGAETATPVAASGKAAPVEGAWAAA